MHGTLVHRLGTRLNSIEINFPTYVWDENLNRGQFPEIWGGTPLNYHISLFANSYIHKV